MTSTRSAGRVYRRCGCTDPDTGKAWGDRCPKLRLGGRHGSWYLRLELAAGLDGHRRRIRRGGLPTRKAAQEALKQLRGPATDGTGPAVVTVGEWLAHWIGTRNRESSTVRGHVSHIKLCFQLYLANLVLTELSVAHLQAMFAAIARDHRALGKPLTLATMQRIRATLRTALNAAIRQGLISDNPAARMELLGARRPRAVV